jgi:hypothetical protein
MDIVKNNWFSIGCGVVVIAALIAAYTPLGGQVQQLQANLDQSAQTNRKMHDLLTRSRTLPLVDPSKTEAAELPVFPSQTVINDGKKIVAKIHDQSLAMREAAVKMNKHELLTQQSLPIPPSQGVQFQFRIDYTNLMIPPAPQQLPRLVAPMKPGMPPTVEEVTKAKQKVADDIKSKRMISVNAQVPPQIQQAVDEEIAAAQQKLPDQMRMAVAKKSLVYVNPDAFASDPQIQGATAPDPVDIFSAQLMLWVQQDVIAAVNECNAGSADVTAAPVKRVIKVDVQPSFVKDASVPTSGDADAPIGKALSVSPTGRVSNPLYDVVHFTVNVDVDATKVDKFLHHFSKDRLMNVYNLNISNVDLADRLAAGYAYGDAPVVNLQMDCEALFLRNWLVAYMPPTIKQSLGIQPQGAGGEQSANAGY